MRIIESQIVFVEPDCVQLLNFNDYVGPSANHICIHCKCNQSFRIIYQNYTMFVLQHIVVVPSKKVND